MHSAFKKKSFFRLLFYAAIYSPYISDIQVKDYEIWRTICTTNNTNRNLQLRKKQLSTLRIVIDPRSQGYFIVTGYGVINLVGSITWERAELLVSIAPPDFREDLIKAAKRQKIWRRSNNR